MLPNQTQCMYKLLNIFYQQMNNVFQASKFISMVTEEIRISILLG